jgi:radical SAM superfamily enzyme YgiQ (UPF0313 family)
MKQSNIKGAYIGIETGNDELLKFLNKPGSAELALEVISLLKEAKLKVGIIVMAGVGGGRFAKAHLNDTLQLLNSMSLEREDIIYLSEFVEHPSLEYSQHAAQHGIKPLGRFEIECQFKAFKAGIRLNPRPRIAKYDIREFVY